MISRDEFLAVYNKHLPNKWTEAAFRYFSTTTAKKDKWVSRIVEITLGTLFIAGFIATMTSKTFVLSAIIILIFGFILFSLAAFMGGAAIMNNLRILKIIKILGITRDEYNSLVDLYLIT
jgi:hypothetical protein